MKLKDSIANFIRFYLYRPRQFNFLPSSFVRPISQTCSHFTQNIGRQQSYLIYSLNPSKRAESSMSGGARASFLRLGPILNKARALLPTQSLRLKPNYRVIGLWVSSAVRGLAFLVPRGFCGLGGLACV